MTLRYLIIGRGIGGDPMAHEGGQTHASKNTKASRDTKHYRSPFMRER